MTRIVNRVHGLRRPAIRLSKPHFAAALEWLAVFGAAHRRENIGRDGVTDFLGDNGRHTPAEEPRPDHPAVPVTDPGAATSPSDGSALIRPSRDGARRVAVDRGLTPSPAERLRGAPLGPPHEATSPRVHCPGGEVASPTDAADVDASVGGAPKNVPDSNPG